jgi:hypothetical protein
LPYTPSLFRVLKKLSATALSRAVGLAAHIFASIRKSASMNQ